MEQLLSPRPRPLPTPVLLATGLATLVVLVASTAAWRPWGGFVGLVPFVYLAPQSLVVLVVLLAGALVSAVLVATPWLAVRRPWWAIGVALAYLLPCAVGPTALHFGVVAALAAIAVPAAWVEPRAALASTGLAAGVVVLWLAVPTWEMAAPMGATIQHDYWTLGRTVVTGLFYLVALAVVLGLAFAVRAFAAGESERRALSSRAGAVEEQAGVVAERARLARDLHDVVAHHVSLIAVRAETAPYTHPGLAPEARTLLADIAADARLALDELRGVLGILGRSGEGAERAPQPSWHDVEALVERARAAGAPVELRGDTGADVAPGVGYVAYRVVQEALTNARKHAAGQPVVVGLRATSHLVVVRVASRLPAGVVAAGHGQGLVGMRERVEALGGTLATGPVGAAGEGEFVVEATMPRAHA